MKRGKCGKVVAVPRRGYSQQAEVEAQPLQTDWLQKSMFLIGVPFFIGIAAYRYISGYLDDRLDTTKQIDMGMALDDVFHTTVYAIIDNPDVNRVLGGPIQVESSTVRMGWDENTAWIYYPVISTKGSPKIGNVLVELIKTNENPHEWQVVLVEVDFNNGHKMQLDGVEFPPFNLLERFEKLIKQMEDERRKEIRARREQQRREIEERRNRARGFKNSGPSSGPATRPPSAGPPFAGPSAGTPSTLPAKRTEDS